VHPLLLLPSPLYFGNPAASLQKEKPVALRPRLTTGLPLSRRSSEEMRLTLETIGITGIRCTGVKRSRGVQAKESVQRESGRKLPHCPYSLYFREGVFSEIEDSEAVRGSGFCCCSILPPYLITIKE